MQLDRRTYSNQKQHDSFLRLLLTHDGSTTRLCEAVEGAPMQIHLHQQQTVSQVPAEVLRILGGNVWLQRVTSLHNAPGEVFMDNLSFTRLDTLPDWFIEALNEGHTPIGRLLDQLFIKRVKTSVSSELKNLLWNTVGMPDERASRSYYVATPEGPFMLIFEVFRDVLTKLDRV